jgi:hypothetical protein
MPNETLRRFHSPIKLDDNPNDQCDWRTHPLPNFGHFDEAIELYHDQFHPFHFNILLLHPNYSELKTTRMIHR